METVGIGEVARSLKIENELLKLNRRQKKEGRTIAPRPNQSLRRHRPTASTRTTMVT
jgi:hypothetical protein